MRGLVDKKGEQFAVLRGQILYDLEDVATGKREGDFIVDLAGKRVWRIVGDGVYSLDGSESIGYFGSDMPERMTW
ncbi:MAG: hypothetical protein KA362_09225 [Chloroflexi bacterium]|jgi:hypothetical protein|nr:hypothetical protein [Chloroflexota bacterium]MBK6710657.1 hypothetical protein [Chloroflexota bacterium]MBK7179092.1 hypothetical protein [Chloroflexota bacterium]MBK7917422.1 hypothetical protein [Chloroflexota bacterium]MBK8933210.1 hypothetical protein [Chloroflexota bacterium]